MPSLSLANMEIMEHTFNYISSHLLRVDALLVIAAWLSMLVGAIIYYVWQHPAPNKGFKGFFVYVFPKELWQHPSCRRDYWFAVINRIVEPITIGVVLITTSTVSFAIYYALTAQFGPHAEGNPHIAVWVAITVLVIMVRDFFVWFSHYLEHKIPVLWQIHAVHHSAEFLNPLSNRRHHPLQLVWEGGLSNVAAGLTLGTTSYIFHINIIDTALMGVDAYFICDVLSFYQLRHSHIPLHYGKWEKWFLSPRSHQLHHSYETQDWDKNFGLLTSIWDRLFGTMNVRPADYTYRLGLQSKYQKDYDTVLKFYTTPMINISHILLDKMPKEPHSTNTTGS